MRSKAMIFAAAAAAALSACAPMDDQGTMGASAASADMTPEDRTNFVMMAGASDLYEIQSSRIAQSKSRNEEVRQFAAMLIQHHTQTTEQVVAAARAAGMNPPPPKLLPMQERMIRELNDTSAADIDRVYLRQQVPAHEMALGLHSNYAENGDTPSLQAAARGAVPIVQSHLDRARQLLAAR